MGWEHGGEAEEGEDEIEVIEINPFLRKGGQDIMTWFMESESRLGGIIISNKTLEKVESRQYEELFMEADERAWEDIEVNRILKILVEMEKMIKERVDMIMIAKRREEAFPMKLILKEDTKC